MSTQSCQYSGFFLEEGYHENTGDFATMLVKITFPDQYNKGTVGKIGGMAIVKQAKYIANARILYKYCLQKWWRKKLAAKLKLFPFVDEMKDNLSNTLLYNEVIKNWEFIKKVQKP